jgi:hypothetical protein
MQWRLYLWWTSTIPPSICWQQCGLPVGPSHILWWICIQLCKWQASFSLQTMGTALQLSVCADLHMLQSCVCSLLGWIIHEGDGILHHTEEHLDGLQYKLNLKHNGVICKSALSWWSNPLSKRTLHHSHNSCVVQEWLLWQTDVELTKCPPWMSDMNPTENMWNEVKKRQEIWADLPPGNKRCSLDLCVWYLQWSCFVSALCVISNWDHAKMNEISVSCSGILAILLKIPGLKNSNFNDYQTKSHFLSNWYILWNRSNSKHVFFK